MGEPINRNNADVITTGLNVRYYMDGLYFTNGFKTILKMEEDRTTVFKKGVMVMVGRVDVPKCSNAGNAALLA